MNTRKTAWILFGVAWMVMGCTSGHEPATNAPIEADTVEHWVCGGVIDDDVARPSQGLEKDPEDMLSAEMPPFDCPWQKTIALQDQRGGETPEVARLTIQAWWMGDRISLGHPIPCAQAGATSIHFPHDPDGEYFIKFKLMKVDWSLCKEYDGSDKYKVIMRNVWQDVEPKLWMLNPKENATKFRKRYVTTPNIEYVQGDSLPPPTIFKIGCNGNFRFHLGFRAVTPYTKQEKPTIYPIDIQVSGTGLRLKN